MNSKAKNEIEVKKEMIQISTDNPEKIYTVEPHFGKIEIKEYERQPRIDTPDTLATVKAFGGFFKNGKVISPTNSWKKYKNRIVVRG